MSDLLSVMSAVAGLVVLSAQLGTRSEQLYGFAEDAQRFSILARFGGLPYDRDSAKVAPGPMLQLQTEMENIHLIFMQVEMFVRGVTKKKPSKKGLAMISLHHMLTILTGCILVLSTIDEKLSELAGLMDPITKTPKRNMPCTIDGVKWALWKEAEIGVMIQELQRYKTSLNIMLSLIQCNSTSEANTSLENLRVVVDEISQSNYPTSVQLRALISRQHDVESAISSPPTSEDIPDTTSNSFRIDSSSASGSSTSPPRADQSDNSPILPKRSIQSLTTALFSSSTYKKFGYHRSGSGADSSAVSFPSPDSSATKGGRWSMLSDISLEQLSISGIGVQELPIGLSDVYDSQVYEFAIKMNLESQAKEHSQVDQRKGWSSRGRVHNAIRTNSSFALRTMINWGVDIEEKDSKGRTPLCLAAREGNLEACTLLLGEGAAVNTPDSSGRTTLSYAAAKHSWDICQLLVEKGAEVNAPDPTFCTPLAHAASKQEWKLCQLLLEKGAKVNVADSSGRTPLSHAAGSHYRSSLDICKFLVDKGAAVDAPDSSGRTPLSHAAICPKALDICRFLVDTGAAVDTPDSSGRTPLSHAAIQSDTLDICRFLVDSGAAVDTPDSFGRTPLSHAADSPGTLIDMCNFLVDKGAAVDASDSSGRSPLSYAAGKSELRICQILVNKGAAVDAPDSSGRTPLSYAAAFSRWSSALDTCKFLVDQGAAVDAPDSSGRTPLSHAAGSSYSNSLDICKFLIDKGAAVNQSDSSDFSPYSYARHGFQHRVCQFLLENGANN